MRLLCNVEDEEIVDSAGLVDLHEPSVYESTFSFKHAMHELP